MSYFGKQFHVPHANELAIHEYTNLGHLTIEHVREAINVPFKIALPSRMSLFFWIQRYDVRVYASEDFPDFFFCCVYKIVDCKRISKKTILQRWRQLPVRFSRCIVRFDGP